MIQVMTMFKVRKIQPSDYEKINAIKQTLGITDDYFNHESIVTMVMIEDGEYKGFVSYQVVDELSFVMDHLYTTQVFTDHQTKDLLFRSLLNYGLMHGKIYAYALANKEDNFYANYDFEMINQQKINELNKLINNQYTIGYKINITAFFNRPCDA